MREAMDSSLLSISQPFDPAGHPSIRLLPLHAVTKNSNKKQETVVLAVVSASRESESSVARAASLSRIQEAGLGNQIVAV